MENYKNLHDLRPGAVLAEDIFANTVHPIVRKGTTLTIEELEVLSIFGVKRVKVEDRIVNRVHSDRNDLRQAGDIESDVNQLLEGHKNYVSDFRRAYDKAVQEYKKEFTSWRAGGKLDIAKVRLLIMPLLESFLNTTQALINLNEYSNRKDYLYHHAVSVGMITAALGNTMGFPKGITLQLGLAGVLADSGMAKIHPNLLEKAAFLTKEEFNEVKKHPIFSYKMMQDSPLLRQEMKLAVLQHHERLDGSGYPRGDENGRISQYAQVLAVADVFHAMTCERVYRSKESPYKVAEMLKEEEFGKFDIEVVEALYSLIVKPASGDSVLLTNGESGKVVESNNEHPFRPVVNMKHNGMELDLTVHRLLYIEKIIQK